MKNVNDTWKIERSLLLDDGATWKIFIEIMQDEYLTIKSELNRLLKNRKMSPAILKHLEILQTSLLDKEQFLADYKKSFLRHLDELSHISGTDIYDDQYIAIQHKSLYKDQENIKSNLMELKKTFSEFMRLLHEVGLIK